MLGFETNGCWLWEGGWKDRTNGNPVKIPVPIFWLPFKCTSCHTHQAGQAQKEATKSHPLEGSGTSWGGRSQFTLGKGKWEVRLWKQQGGKWSVSQKVTSSKAGNMSYWPTCHRVLQKKEVSSLGRLIPEAFRKWANTGLRRSTCSGCGWRYWTLHLSFMWGSPAPLATTTY